MSRQTKWGIPLSLFFVGATILPFACQKSGPGGGGPVAAAAADSDSVMPGVKKGQKLYFVVGQAHDNSLLLNVHQPSVVQEVRGNWISLKGKRQISNDEVVYWVNINSIICYQVAE
jgi:hypothetical protein